MAEFAPLCRHEASRWRAPGEGWDDHLQAALVGLWRAWRDFDPERGVPFQAWAAMRMRGEVGRLVRAASAERVAWLRCADRDEVLARVPSLASDDPAVIVPLRLDALARLRRVRVAA